METTESENPREPSFLTVQEIAFCVGAHPRTIERLVRMEIIEPARREPELCFDPLLLEKVRKAFRLKAELGVGWTSMALVLDLMERIDRLHEELERAARGERGGP